MQPDNNNNESFVTRPLLPADEESVAALLAATFSSGEMLCKGRISTEELLPFATFIVHAAVAQGLSYIAREKTSGKLAAFAICDDYCAPPPPGIEQVVCKPLVPIFSLLEQLSKRAVVSFPYSKRGEMYHVFMGGTAKQFEGQGLGLMMRQHALEIARQKGYRAVISEPTHPATLHIWKNKLGARTLAVIDVQTFEDEPGSRPFQHLSHQVEVVLVPLPDTK